MEDNKKICITGSYLETSKAETQQDERQMMMGLRIQDETIDFYRNNLHQY